MNRLFTIVPAGAGAGKTHRIKTQLTDWVSSGEVRPDRILAVTFTEAAASELRERIRTSLLAEGMIEEALAVERAYVSTIHGLGLRILTEHAFAAGSSPLPRHLSDAERELLIRQELAHCTELDPIKNNLTRFGYLAAYYGVPKTAEDNFREKVFSVIDLLRGLGDTGANPALVNDATARLKKLYGTTERDGTAIEKALETAVIAMLKAFPEGALTAPDLKKSAKETFRSDIVNLRRVQREPGVLARDWKLWNSLRKLRQTKRGTPTPSGYDAAADAVMHAAEGLLRHPGPLADAILHLECLLTGSQAIMSRYGARKRELGVIDFADMIVDAERLLRLSPEVLDALMAEVDCVIVDEFQDTNPVQFALLWRLARQAPRTLLVGDVKQSIMGFQGADPRLTEALIAQFAGSVAPLDRNWRSDPRLMDFINTIGERLFGDSYTVLAPTREATGETSLEIIRVSQGRTSKKSRPEQHVAARIQAILSGSEQVVDRHSGEIRTARPSDIAILCNSHNKAKVYADALQRLGLPVLINRVGWLSCTVISVARHALALAADPNDGHAALCLLTLGPRALPLEEALRDLADGRLLERAELHAVRQLSELAVTAPVSTLVARVLDVAGLRDWAEGLPDPQQALADLLRLEHEAQEFELAHRDMKAAAGFHGFVPQAFLGWLVARKDERDFDRHPDPSSGSALGIEIVTWHASKGREWPIVVVVELDQKIGERSGSNSTEFADFSDLDNVLSTARLIHTPDFAAAEKKEIFVEDRRLQAESDARKLIYVALTRARDRLILEWPEFALKEKDGALAPPNHAAFLQAESGLTIGAGEIALGEEKFPARIVAAGDETPPEFDATAPASSSGYTGFGERRAPVAKAPRTAWRRRPSEATTAPVLPGPLRHHDIGAPVKAAIDEHASATERGTAWHLAFRTLAARPELSDRLGPATGLDTATIAAIGRQADGVRRWLEAEGYPKLHFELPIQIVEDSGAELNAVIDCLAEGEKGYLIIDHKSGPAPDPEARFLTYWPQLSAYAEAVQRVFPDKPVLQVAVNWMNDGVISMVRLS